MRWLTIVVVTLTALALAGAGCGGDDEEASDATTLTDTTTDDTTTDETTTDETTTDTDDTDDLGSIATGECTELIEASSKLSEAFGASGGTSDDIDDVSAFFDEFVDTAPEEIRADFQVLADAWEVYADVLPDLQVEPGQTPDPEALAELQQAIASLDQEEVTAASERISAWAETNCPSG